MGSPLEAQLILCDAAQAEPSGKIHMLGAGWSMVRGPAPHAVAVLIKVPWDRTNEPLPLHLVLKDADGQPVQIPTSDGLQKVESGGKIEAGRPPGVPAGIMLNASFALNIPALPLAPGRYEWVLELAELTRSESFTVLA